MPKHHQEKQFGLIMATITAVIALWPLLNAKPPSAIWGITSLTLLIITWQAATLLTPVVKVWIKVGHILMILNTKILLAIAFYLIITPLALFFKLIRRDALGLQLKKSTSYWLIQKKKWSPKSFKNQF